MSFSNAYEEIILNSALRNVAFPAAASIFVKLYVGDPGEDGTANAAANTTRQAVTFAAAVNPAGTAATNADVIWTNVSNSETYSYIGIWTSATVGTFIIGGPLTAPVAVTAGQTFTLTSGTVIATVT